MTTRTEINLDWTVGESGRERSYWHTQDVDHGVLDERGRRVGGYATIERRMPGTYYGPSRGFVPSGEPDIFELSTHSTRDGDRYGAIPRGKDFSTLEAAQAAAPAALLAQRRRYVRKYAREAS